MTSAKRFAKSSERTGALRKSIGKVVRSYPEKGNAIAIVGPRHGYYRSGKKLGVKASKRGSDSPVKYGHLIEYGHHTVSPEKGKTVRRGTAKTIGWVPAKPFLRPAILASKSAVQAALQKGITDGMEKVRLECVKDGLIKPRASVPGIKFSF